MFINKTLLLTAARETARRVAVNVFPVLSLLEVMVTVFTSGLDSISVHKSATGFFFSSSETYSSFIG